MKTKQMPLSLEMIGAYSGRSLPLMMTLGDGEQYAGVGTLCLGDGANRKNLFAIDFDWLVRIQPANSETGISGLRKDPVKPIKSTLREQYKMEFEYPSVLNDVGNDTNPWITIGTAEHTTIYVSKEMPEHFKAVREVRDFYGSS